MKAHYAAAPLLALTSSMHCAFGQQPGPETPQRVTQSAIVEIMRAERNRGYDITATANAVRLQSAVIVQLARAALTQGATQAPLLIGHEQHFRAYLEATGLSEDHAPPFARVAHDHGEDLLIEYRSDHVISKLGASPAPAIAVTVCGGWPSASPARYAYEDLASTPHIRSVHERVHSFRLLELDGMIVHDEIRGIGGRATSGALGVLFRVVGNAHAAESRMRVTPDGLLLVYAVAEKGPFRVPQVVTVTPDGRTARGAPPNRPDLAGLQEQIERPLDIKYVPFVCRPGESLVSEREKVVEGSR